MSLDLEAEDIVIEIGIPLRVFPGRPGDEARFVGTGGAIARFDADAHVGLVTVDDGRVYFNGRPPSAKRRRGSWRGVPRASSVVHTPPEPIAGTC